MKTENMICFLIIALMGIVGMIPIILVILENFFVSDSFRQTLIELRNAGIN